MVDHQDDDSADYCHHHAVEIEAGDAAGSDGSEDEAANNRADDAEHDVEEEAFAGFVDDLAGDETGNQPQNDPPDDRHHAPVNLDCMPRLTARSGFGSVRCTGGTLRGVADLRRFGLRRAPENRAS